MRPRPTLLLSLTALGGAVLLLLGLGLVLLYAPYSRAMMRESVDEVTREFHERNATPARLVRPWSRRKWPAKTSYRSYVNCPREG